MADHDDENVRMEEEEDEEDDDAGIEVDGDDEEVSEVNELIAQHAPKRYTTSSFYVQTRKRARIIKRVTELYIRDDLGFGCYYVDDRTMSESRKLHVDKILGKPHTIESIQHLLSLLRPCQPHSIVVCDTNVLLHNLDVLEQASAVMPNIVIPQTALQECRANQVVAYDRTVELLRSVGGGQSETSSTGTNSQRCCIYFPDPHHVSTALSENTVGMSINDKNDIRIRNVALYFGEHLRDTNIRVILLTDDAASRRKVEPNLETPQVCYEARSVRSWVQELEQHNPNISLLDLVAQLNVSSHEAGSKPLEKSIRYEPHLELSDLNSGIQNGVYHRGVLRSRDSESAIVTIRRGEERVAVSIENVVDRNRAVDGDVVTIALHPLDKWIQSSAVEVKTTSKEGAYIANETAEPTLSELSNVQDAVLLDDTNQWRPTGKIVGIIRRNFENHSGSIYVTSVDNKTSAELSEREKIAAEYEREHADGSVTCVFFPVDKKVPPILIRTTQRHRFLGQRIVVAMDSWPVDSPYPLGHYVRTIGLAGTKDVETQVLLQQFDIPHDPFPAAVLACLPPEDYRIDADSSPGRVDLRHIPVLSIDPPNCKDIDDALHCIELANGNYQVGVHIADVTHYVKAGTAIDIEAASRSTSTYLVNKRLDMLPGLLTTDLCSLKGNVDRYAFSVLWEVTTNAEIVNVDFRKSLIHSIAALTYQQAQDLIDQPDNESDIQASAVKRLALLARKFRQRRIDAGALTLASPEVKCAYLFLLHHFRCCCWRSTHCFFTLLLTPTVVLDTESLNPTDVQAYALLEANAVVEEFMLLANVTVAKKILRHYPTLSILRRHPAPNRAMFDSLISKARCRSLAIDIEDSKRLADSLDAAQIPSDPYINKLLRILSTRCMSPAQYFCSGEFRPQEWHHYGLAAPVYTHFTSPIRRYSDVVVHRLLAASIGVAPLPTQLASKSYLHDLAANMNRRHRAAQLAGRASVQLHTLIFFAGDGAKDEFAYVLEVETAESSFPTLLVMVPRYGIEGRVKLNIDASDPCLSRYPNDHKIVYRHDQRSFSIQVFDRVKVRIWVKEIQDHQRELVLDLLEPNIVA